MVPPVTLPEVSVEMTPVTALKIVVKRLVEVAFVNIGLLVKVYVTRPEEVVATVKFEFVEDARKL